MGKTILYIFIVLGLWSCKNPLEEEGAARKPAYQSTHELRSQKNNIKPDSVLVVPIEHASFVIQLEHKTIYVDPMEDAKLYKDFPAPDLILITFDNPELSISQTLRTLIKGSTVLVAPESVELTFPKTLAKRTVALKKRQDTLIRGVKIAAIAKEDSVIIHQGLLPKESDNSYVIETNKNRVYIPGRKTVASEIKNLKDIDLAFVRMDMPDSLALNEAVDVIVDLEPHQVYPYAYETTRAFSDVALFKRGIERGASNVKVVVLNWYPDRG